MGSLTDLGNFLATYGGLSYLVSLSFWDWWVVSNTTLFYLWGMYYLCALLFTIIKCKDALQYSSLHSCDSVSFFLSIFPMYACENYISRKIYFLCLFLASFLIALEILFLQYGLTSTGAFVRAIIIFSNKFLASAVYLTSWSLFNMAVICLMVSEKL